MRDNFISELNKLASVDDSIILITGDLGFGVLTEFAQKFPKQFINAGVAEQNMTGLACGLASEGFKVYTYSIGNFPTLRCLEQIRNDICYHDVNVTVVSVGAGFSYGQLGVSHFATEDLAIMRSIPNMKVVAPSDSWETNILTNQMYQINGPKYLRLDKGIAGLPDDSFNIKFGEANIVHGGNDVTIVSIGGILKEAIIASNRLKEYNIDARVISYHSLKPFDENKIIDAAKETGGIVCIEEHSKIGGLASTVSETLMHAKVFPGFFKCIGIDDEFPTIVGDQEYLRNHYKINSDTIFNTINRELKK